MDLKNLLIDKPQGARTAKKTVEELRQGMYKRTGVKSSSEGRALRSIQVRERGILFLVSLYVASY